MTPSGFLDLYLGFGSNLGDSTHLITRAIMTVAQNAHIRYEKQSSMWRSQPMYDVNQPMFVNAVVKYSSDLNPTEILDYIQWVEKKFLRIKDPQRPKGPRTLDIDILFYGNLQIDSDRLHIPHPGFKERNFVLFPMAEIDLDYKVAGTNTAIGEWKKRCPDTSKVEKV